MIKSIKGIYDALSDLESKEIFINRLNYNITGNFKYIADIVSKYSQEITQGFSWQKFIGEMKKLSEQKKIVIYGAGGGGTALYSVFKSSGIDVDSFCDRNSNLNGMKEIPVISCDKLVKRYKAGDQIAVVIGTEIYFDEVYEILKSNGIDKNDIYGGRADITKQYFDKELLGLSDDEYFIDCGALDLQTTKNFLKVCPKGSAYAFEPDRYNFDRCMKLKKDNDYKNVEVYNYGCGSHDETLRFLSIQGGSSTVSDNGNTEISVTSIDKVLKEKKVTFIKMDIEGMELDALKGACEIIKNQKPKLAISIYHKDEDLIDIPKYIKELVPEYKLYIRHYSIYPAETVLYAVI